MIRLPAERAQAGVVGILEKTMYGARDASQAWQTHYTKVLTENTFSQGVASPACFYSKQHDIRLHCHGGDFQVDADEDGLAFFDSVLDSQCDYKKAGRSGGGP